MLASRYRLGETLGSGGMATVYDAVDERLQRPVAVKVLQPALAVRPDVRARFESEARAAAQLTHPNVVAVFDTGESPPDGTPFLVMERLPGTTLADRFGAAASGGVPVEVDWLLRVAGDVLGALGAAHSAGIVHRDVKPANILLAADGCAKVGDFGIAKSLEVAAAADLTSTNQLIGTPAYLAPERVAGEPATVQADLYALGVVLYEGLAGRKPFGGATPVATAYAIQHETPRPLAEVRPDLPASLVAAVERAMAREPGARFSSAAEMASALGVGLAGVPSAPPPAPDDLDRTILAAAPVPGPGSTQVMPAIEAVPVAAIAGTTDPGVDPATPVAGDRRRRLLLVAAAGLVAALLLFGLAAAAGSGDDADAGTRGADAPSASTTTTAVPTTAPPTTAAPVAVAPEQGGDDDDREDKGKGRKKDDD